MDQPSEENTRIDPAVARGLALEACKEASRVCSLAWGALVAVALWLGKMSVESPCEVVWSWLHIVVLLGVMVGVPASCWAELRRLSRQLELVACSVGSIDLHVRARLLPLVLFASGVSAIYLWPASGALGVEANCNAPEGRTQDTGQHNNN